MSKQIFSAGRYVGGVYICYLKFAFLCVSTVTDIIRPALSGFLNSTLKFLDSCYSVMILRFWCYWSRKKSATYLAFFRKNNVFISAMCFLKKYNIKFQSLENSFSCCCLEDLEHLVTQFLVWTYWKFNFLDYESNREVSGSNLLCYQQAMSLQLIPQAK